MITLIQFRCRSVDLRTQFFIDWSSAKVFIKGTVGLVSHGGFNSATKTLSYEPILAKVLSYRHILSRLI